MPEETEALSSNPYNLSEEETLKAEKLRLQAMLADIEERERILKSRLRQPPPPTPPTAQGVPPTSAQISREQDSMRQLIQSRAAKGDGAGTTHDPKPLPSTEDDDDLNPDIKPAVAQIGSPQADDGPRSPPAAVANVTIELFEEKAPSESAAAPASLPAPLSALPPALEEDLKEDSDASTPQAEVNNIFGVKSRRVGTKLRFLSDGLGSSTEELPSVARADTPLSTPGATADAPADEASSPEPLQTQSPPGSGHKGNIWQGIGSSAPKAEPTDGVPSVPAGGGGNSAAGKAASKPKDGKMGTFLGVFVPCMQNILGTILYLRLSWIVGQAGIGLTLAVIAICCCTTFFTSLSLSAIATNGAIKGGGPYYLISRALGPEFGGSVGLCFYLGTTVAGSMYVLGAVQTIKDSLPGLVLTGVNCQEELTALENECGVCAIKNMNDYRILGVLVLVLLTLVVAGGVKYVSMVSPFVLIPVLLSVFLIWRTPQPRAQTQSTALSLLSLCTGPNRRTTHSLFSPSWPRIAGLPCLTRLWPELRYFEVGIVMAGSGYKEFPPTSGITGNWAVNLPNNIGPDFAANLKCLEVKDADGKPYFTEADLGAYDFLQSLALFFPSVTGIMAGSNRSGDLRNAQVSIPIGTLAAVVVTSIIYLTSAVLYGGVAEREVGLKTNYLLSADASVQQEMVRVGIVMSSLGAGLQSLTGAPRLLQAIANDDLIPLLKVFQGGGEPRKPLLLTAAICTCCVITGDIDVVAPIITMFFLLCYTAVNLAVLLQGLLKEPNWRPRFRLIGGERTSSFTAFLGMCLCLGIMFSTFLIFAIASIVVCCVLWKYIQYRKVAKHWGDGMRGMRYQTARQMLLSLERLSSVHTKNWRPQVLLFAKVTSDGVLHQPGLLPFVGQLKGARGITIISTAIEGELHDDAATQMRIERKLRQARDDHQIRGFTQVVMSNDVPTALETLLQTAGLGGLGPNTVVTCWATSWQTRIIGARRMKQILTSAHAFNMALILIKGIEVWPGSDTLQTQPIDIWWVVHDGGLLMMLAIILHKHRTWRHATIRVFVVCQSGDDPEELRVAITSFLYNMRITATMQVVQLTEALSGILPTRGAEWSNSQGLVMPRVNKAIVSKALGTLDTPDAQTYRAVGVEPSGGSPAGVRFKRQNSWMGNMLEEGESSPGSPRSPSIRPSSLPGSSRSSPFLKSMGVDQASCAADTSTEMTSLALPTAMIPPPQDPPSPDKEPPTPEKEYPVQSAVQPEGSFTSDTGSFTADKESFTSGGFSPEYSAEARRRATMALNRVMVEHSAESALVMTNLPLPKETDDPSMYMEHLEVLMRNIPRALLVAGQRDAEVITMDA